MKSITSLSDIKNEYDFSAALSLRLLEYVGSGSEYGYNAKSRYPNGFRFIGIVRRGFRSGLIKIQSVGLSGPFGNSSQFVTNSYYSLKK